MDGLNGLQYAKTPEGETTIVEQNAELEVFKKWFSDAVDAAQRWRNEAKEDRDFYAGKQWRNEDKDNLEKNQRPALTINRIKPLLNVLSGYQRLNRYDIDFLPRTNDDMELAQVRKGITKYIMDKSHYNYEESDVFMDGAQMGIGWFEVGYQFDWATMDGDAFVRRVSPLDIYVDPESRDKHFRDMKYLVRARWVDKEELIAVYPEHKEAVEAQMHSYLHEEQEYESEKDLWFQKETKKIRFAEMWYKKPVRKRIYILLDGSIATTATPEMIGNEQIRGVREYTVTEVRLLSFFDNVVLENVASPYEHGEFPFVPFVCYYQGDDDMPAGIIRDLKDPQREVNKRRSQELHILNTQSNGGWLFEEGALTNKQKTEFKEKATTPGAMLEVAVNALTGNRLKRLEPQGVAAGAVNAAAEALSDLPAISGINEALMGTDINNLASGRAIELKQKQAITHIAALFDNLRFSKERVAKLLWGKRGAAGVIPQFYTEEKTFRITGTNGGFEFITINKQQEIDDGQGNVIVRTLNDLSVGEYDIVISDTPATITQRTAQFWSLVDACGKLGINGNIILDILLDLSDIPQKEEIKHRLEQLQQQQAQAQQQQMQMQFELEKQKKLSQSISYKDLQLPLQLQLAAKAGIFPQEYADKFMQWYIEQQAAFLMGGLPQPQPYAPNIPYQQPMLPVQQNPQGLQRQAPLTQSAINGFVESNKPII